MLTTHLANRVKSVQVRTRAQFAVLDFNTVAMQCSAALYTTLPTYKNEKS